MVVVRTATMDGGGSKVGNAGGVVSRDLVSGRDREMLRYGH
jgi:hypothetical protein